MFGSVHNPCCEVGGCASDLDAQAFDEDYEDPADVPTAQDCWEECNALHAQATQPTPFNGARSI